MEWTQIHIPKCKKKSHSIPWKIVLAKTCSMNEACHICVLGSCWSMKRSFIGTGPDFIVHLWLWIGIILTILSAQFFNQDLFIKCLISRWNVGYWQLITTLTLHKTLYHRVHGILSLTHFPAHGIMSLSQWLSQWCNDIMPCAGKRICNIMPCARRYRHKSTHTMWKSKNNKTVFLLMAKVWWGTYFLGWVYIHFNHMCMQSLGLDCSSNWRFTCFWDT